MSEAQTEPKQAQTVVTGETLMAFQLDKLGVTQEASAESKPEEKPAEAANPAENTDVKTENADEFIPEDGTVEGSRVVFRGKWVPKSDYNYRMHLKTEEVKKERAAREDLERKVAELQAKSAPKGEEKKDGKPNPNDFQDAFEYAEALAEYKANEALKKRDEAAKVEKQKEAHQKMMDLWTQRLAKAQAEIEDFDDVLNNSPVKNSDFSAEIQAAMIESEVGPQLLYHFAQHPELVEKLKEMTLTSALREVGKLEIKFEKQETTEHKQEKKPTASKAPAPITPARSAPAQGLSADTLFDDKGNFLGTPAQYREARKKGIIK